MKEQFYRQTTLQVLERLHATPQGLLTTEAMERLQKNGPNELPRGKKVTLLQRIIAQFKDLMILILIVAAIVAAFAGELSDTIIILLVVVLNAAFGVFQETKAENAIDALQKMSTPTTRVRRDGQIAQLSSKELVIGDVILLEAGDIIPADVRFLKTQNVKVEEAALTGESVAVTKDEAVIDAESAALGDQHNMGFMNTSMTAGTAEAVVVATGKDTEVGKIAQMLNSAEPTVTPLQRNITHLSKILSVLVLAIAVIIFALGMLTKRETPLDMLLTAISLAVAAIPEGLPAIVTITLALGTQAMAKRHALIRKLQAVETLGATEIIASDKTGTLTKNQMTIEQLMLNGQVTAAPDFKIDADSPLTKAMILANDAERGSQKELLGDPTETALWQFYIDKGLNIDEFRNRYPRLNSWPFDSERKLMSVAVNDKLPTLYLKGAVDELLTRADRILDGEQVREMTAADREQILKINHQLAKQALRVLGYAYRPLTDAESQSADPAAVEQSLIFIGLSGMIDPPRPEVKAAIQEAKEAGIRSLMITGDHKTTARAIAERLGIIEPGDENGAITGQELNELSDQELKDQVAQYSVYARVAPEHKVRIVKAWQAHDKVVAMTGDGVNDAPALKTADIGVGMGITGTEVSKNAADVVLADDNFATIIAAVKEGRKVFANIQKAIQYLLSANLGEVLTLLIMTMMNWSILAPVQILWINLVTDTFPAIALGVEPAEGDVMKHQPRGNQGSFLAHGVGFNIIYQGILEGLLTLGVYALGILYPVHQGSALIHADALTMAYITLGLIQLLHACNCKSLQGTIFKTGEFRNRYFNWAILSSTLLLAGTIFIPTLNPIFHTTELDLAQWGIVIAAGLLMVLIVEIVKAVQRHQKN
ncbi:cation-translocating P-type ATPase [Limosilactobacillus mucosae]|uniref:cation-translocating P-type ATPase n=1 Tax=Limosilactobacillus mucosae TaxID=97478 RepID=UPI0022E36022|nr:cation-translocating P-type ATPase [Limosilactobacillus mucosae]